MGAISNVLKGRSKTVNFNALFLALVAIAGALGFTPSADVVAAIQTVLNIVLRFVTDTPLADKT